MTFFAAIPPRRAATFFAATFFFGAAVFLLAFFFGVTFFLAMRKSLSSASAPNNTPPLTFLPIFVRYSTAKRNVYLEDSSRRQSRARVRSTTQEFPEGNNVSSSHRYSRI